MGDRPMDRARGLDGCGPSKSVGRKTKIKTATSSSNLTGRTRRVPASLKDMTNKYQTYILKIYPVGVAKCDKPMRRPRREWTRLSRMKEHVHLTGLRVERIKHGRNVNWIPLGILGIDRGDLTTKFLTAIRPRQS